MRRGVWPWLLVLLFVAATGTAPSALQAKDKDKATAPIIAVEVPGDRTIEVVLGPMQTSKVIVYLHGVCGNPLAFETWAAAAREHATFISMRGDRACKKRKGRYEWSYDLAGLNRRIDRAIDAVDKLRSDLVDSTEPAKLDRSQVVLIGYSQGAHRVESMAHRFHERFPRVVIIAPAREPDAAKLNVSERVLLIAGEKDAKKHIRDAHDKLEKAGRPVKYLELPEARHGEYGPQAQEVMAQGLDWLYK